MSDATVRWNVCEPNHWPDDHPLPAERIRRTWVVGRRPGGAVAFVSGVTPEETEANARLIAAAPELLAVLQQALDETEDGLHHAPCDEPACWVEAAQRAIARTQESKMVRLDRSDHDAGVGYRGEREGGTTAADRVLVMVVDDRGRMRPLRHRCRPDQHCHSPAGFNWGYGGSGPSELARAILWDFLGGRPHPALYQDFKAAFVARFPQAEGWQLASDAILTWLRERDDDTTWLEPPPIAGRASAIVAQLQRELEIRARLGVAPGKAGAELVIAERWAVEDARLGAEEEDDDAS